MPSSTLTALDGSLLREFQRGRCLGDSTTTDRATTSTADTFRLVRDATPPTV